MYHFNRAGQGCWSLEIRVQQPRSSMTELSQAWAQPNLKAADTLTGVTWTWRWCCSLEVDSLLQLCAAIGPARQPRVNFSQRTAWLWKSARQSKPNLYLYGHKSKPQQGHIFYKFIFHLHDMYHIYTYAHVWARVCSDRRTHVWTHEQTMQWPCYALCYLKSHFNR